MRLSPRSFVLAAAMVVIAAASSRGQSPAPAGPVDLSAVRKDLKSLISAQETYFSNHNAYAISIGSLDFTPTEGVTIKLVETGMRAWSGSGTLTGKSGVSCVVFVGSVAAIPKTEQGVAAKTEGGPMCDGDPPAQPTRKLH